MKLKSNQLSSRFKQVFHNTGFGIMIVDKNRNLIEVNPKFCEMLGFTKEELIGKNAQFIHISNKAYKEFGEKWGLKARARIKGTAKIGTDPTIMLTGPINATEKVLTDTKLDIKDIDLFEVNEAFASVALLFLQAFDGYNPAKFVEKNLSAKPTVKILLDLFNEN